MIERKHPRRGSAKQWQSTEVLERDRVRPEGLAQARRWTHLLPAQSPTIPTLRANPFPEVTDPICRLPLPTLFYRPEAVNLGDLLRIWVRAGAIRRNLPRIFKVPPGTRGCRENCGTLRQNQNPFSLREDSRDSAAYAEKTTLPRAPVGVS